MRCMTRNIVASGLLALASHTVAQVANLCRGEACFKLNIPQSTVDSGSGDIFFQISAPSNWEWVALGQGTGMAGSNMFLVYTTAGGNNVTLSPRRADGHSLPNFNSDAQVTLLEGSGVSGGKMIANVKCSNCNSWNGGTANFKANSGNWIHAHQSSGGPKNSNDNNVDINQHDVAESFQWSWASAKGGNSVNPLVGASTGPVTTNCVPRPAGATAPPATATQSDDDDDNTTRYGRPWRTGSPEASPTDGHYGPPYKRQNVNYCDDTGGFTAINSGAQNQRKMLIAHGTLAALAFVIFFPAGAIAIRLASFPGIVWFHAAFQVFAYLVYIAAFGLGVYIASQLDLIDQYHPIIGIVVFVILFFQPLFGFLHHAMFKKHGCRTSGSHVHLWLGRLAITLGIINGGLGFMLAETNSMSSRSGMIAYSVIAGVVWLVWVAASIYGESKRKTARAAHPPKYSESPPADETGAPQDVPAPLGGHYAPK